MQRLQRHKTDATKPGNGITSALESQIECELCESAGLDTLESYLEPEMQRNRWKRAIRKLLRISQNHSQYFSIWTYLKKQETHSRGTSLFITSLCETEQVDGDPHFPRCVSFQHVDIVVDGDLYLMRMMLTSTFQRIRFVEMRLQVDHVPTRVVGVVALKNLEGTDFLAEFAWGKMT